MELPDGRRWNGLAYLHDKPTKDDCPCPACDPLRMPPNQVDPDDSQRLLTDDGETFVIGRSA